MKRKYSNILVLKKQQAHRDFIIFLVTGCLCLFGLVMVFESSNVNAFRDFGDQYYFVKDQLAWIVLGTVGLVFTSFYDYHKYYKLALPLLIGTIVLLVLVFIPGLGIQALGARRWLGIGNYSLQPAEFAKLTMAIYLAAWFAHKEKGRLLAFLLLVGLVAGLVILEPDLGTSLVLLSSALVMYFISGAPLWHFVAILPLGLSGILLLSITAPYRLKRLTTFLNPNEDPLGASYHIRQILIALGSGGLFGLGFGASRQKYEYLPEATTDSIFAIIGEEFGFLGAAIIILLYLLLLTRLIKIVINAPDRFGMFLASGLFSVIATQIVLNLGSMTTVFPLTGVPLPLISYGGSNMIVTLTSIGILLNIKKQGVTKK
ncbi:putative lipid II flippase FtsW [Candidatus Gottesmanbacteria bacterium]|nr:putative lipid II flippase FtsW [Candidatus Gottesmanbacteria bacterium]